MKYMAACSFGKDSIATVILAKEHKEPLDEGGLPSFPSGHRSAVGRGFSEALLLFLHGGELRRLRE